MFEPSTGTEWQRIKAMASIIFEYWSDERMRKSDYEKGKKGWHQWGRPSCTLTIDNINPTLATPFEADTKSETVSRIRGFLTLILDPSGLETNRLWWIWVAAFTEPVLPVSIEVSPSNMYILGLSHLTLTCSIEQRWIACHDGSKGHFRGTWHLRISAWHRHLLSRNNAASGSFTIVS